MIDNGFWRVQCPARGPALTHAHSLTCESQHGTHFFDECCHCNLRVSEWNQLLDESGSHVPDHVCAQTRNQAGRCSVCGEQVPMPGILGDIDPSVDPLEAARQDCLADHASVVTYSRCPQCDVMAEPKRISGNGPTGRPDEPGRGDLGERMKRRLNEVAARNGYPEVHR